MDDSTPPPPDHDVSPPPPPPPAISGSPTDFLKGVVGKRVIVRLTSGVDYRGTFVILEQLSLQNSLLVGILSCLDGYMNIALEQTEEYVNGAVTNRYGDAFIRGNNGQCCLRHEGSLSYPFPHSTLHISRRVNHLICHSHTISRHPSHVTPKNSEHLCCLPTSFSNDT